MLLPKFALVSFSTFSGAFDNEPLPVGNPAGRGTDYDLKQHLEPHREWWVRADVGTFVFKTREGWTAMQTLLEMLRRKGRVVAVVYFEDSLFGHFDSSTIALLENFGVAVHGTALLGTWLPA